MGTHERRAAAHRLDELLQKAITLDVFQEPRRRAEMLRVMEAQGRVEGVQCVWKRKDGRLLTVRLNGRCVRNEEGQITSLEMMAEDVTQRLAIEEQLRHAQKMEAVGRLAGEIAHDFNNPLTSVLLTSVYVTGRHALLNFGLSYSSKWSKAVIVSL